MRYFFKEAVTTLRTTGSLRPSSKYLISDCLKTLNFRKGQTILEFGMGDGCITQEILNKMCTNSHLISFEVNENFYRQGKKRLVNLSNLTIVNDSAFDFEMVLDRFEIEKVDFIISSLPLTLLPDHQVETLISSIPTFLKSGGCFVQYQYSIDKYKLMKQQFSRVNVGFTFRNLPPTFIYRCSVK